MHAMDKAMNSNIMGFSVNWATMSLSIRWLDELKIAQLDVT